MKTRLILRCSYSLGDIVLLTAAVRDLHRGQPGAFLTDVRTPFPELWEHNPYLTRLSESDPGVRVVRCHYPLVDWADQTPQHCLNGFAEFLNIALGLRIRISAFHGDIHLSRCERGWMSQVQELTGQDTPFWIINAGGKHDLTIKWWDWRRYQEVVDHFRGRVLFVQVGAAEHHHPKLAGALDLRGQTSVRQLLRLVHHAQGVLCGVTGLMHLAAAVPRRAGVNGLRPCVVVAGGREPVHWEQYPGHQFLHTIGALPCCATGGCWRARTVRLGDGDEQDHPSRLCVDVRGGLPHCMDLITAQDVIRRIETCFAAEEPSRTGAPIPRYLTPGQARAARRGLAATQNTTAEPETLTRYSARAAAESFVQRLPPCPGGWSGRGIVICAGLKYFPSAWVCVNLLRHWGCRLPIQLWHLGGAEFEPGMARLMAGLEVECVDASAVRRRHPVRRLGGWELKPYALRHCPFREALLLDADNVPVANPEYLFEGPQYRRTGAVFWPDYGQLARGHPIWSLCGLPPRLAREFESGQVLLDKVRCWRPLALCLWYNEHSDFFYQHLLGDKDTFQLAFRKLGQPFALVPIPIHSLPKTMCQSDFQGRRLFQHRNGAKWDLLGRNPSIPDFWHEELCRDLIRDLGQRWDSLDSWFKTAARAHGVRRRRGRRAVRPARIRAVMISVPERASLRRATLAHLAASDWGDEPVLVQMDRHSTGARVHHITRNGRQALERSLGTDADYVLFLEDDLLFNRHLRHNLETWPLLQRGEITLASLFHPGLREWVASARDSALVVDPESVYGSQALLLSRPAVRYILEHWDDLPLPLDLKMPRLAARLRAPVYYHWPSLVQHVGVKSAWGGRFFQSPDFDPDWKRAE